MVRNVLIVSSDSGSGEAAKAEVFDALLFHDMDLEVVDTSHKDLYLVKTNLGGLKAHSIIMKSLPTHISRIIPVEEMCRPDLNEIKQTCLRLVKSARAKRRRPKSFAVRAKVRGSTLSGSLLEKEIGAFVRQMEGLAVDLEHPDILIHVDVIDDLGAIAVLPGGFPISAKSLRQSILSGIDYMPERPRSNKEKEG